MDGNKVEVPSSYVKRITLKMEDVYDKEEVLSDNVKNITHKKEDAYDK